MVTANAVVLYPSIPHTECLDSPSNILEEHNIKKIPSETLLELADLFFEPADWHLFLHYNFYHPERVKTSAVYNKALHIKRICSAEEDFNPIQDGGKKAPYQFFPCNFYKQRN